MNVIYNKNLLIFFIILALIFFKFNWPQYLVNPGFNGIAILWLFIQQNIKKQKWNINKN
jgi:hypothetical protein